MKLEDISLGDIVVLNSGGPDMTVVNIDTEPPEPLIWCSWIGEDSNGHEHGFPAPCLKRVENRRAEDD